MVELGVWQAQDSSGFKENQTQATTDRSHPALYKNTFMLLHRKTGWTSIARISDSMEENGWTAECIVQMLTE